MKQKTIELWAACSDKTDDGQFTLDEFKAEAIADRLYLTQIDGALGVYMRSPDGNVGVIAFRKISHIIDGTVVFGV